MRQLKLRRCECELCDELILTRDVNNQPRKFALGHAGRLNPLFNNKPLKERTKRETARRILTLVLKKDKCEVNNELCKGRLQAHHIDKNYNNNSLDNLLLLCDTHHNFADIRNLSLDQLKNLKLNYIISSNKRRYKSGAVLE